MLFVRNKKHSGVDEDVAVAVQDVQADLMEGRERESGRYRLN